MKLYEHTSWVAVRELHISKFIECDLEFVHRWLWRKTKHEAKAAAAAASIKPTPSSKRCKSGLVKMQNLIFTCKLNIRNAFFNWYSVGLLALGKQLIYYWLSPNQPNKTNRDPLTGAHFITFGTGYKINHTQPFYQRSDCCFFSLRNNIN